MRTLPVCLALLSLSFASACQKDFDDRYEETERDLREKAEEIDRQLTPPMDADAGSQD